MGGGASKRIRELTDLLVMLSARIALEDVGPALGPGRPDGRRRPPFGPHHQPALVAEVQTPVADLPVVGESALRDGAGYGQSAL